MIKEISAQVKGRQTKLEKKTHDELVAIVLKKDKCERNLNSQIVKLKAENNNLSSRISGFDKDINGITKNLDDYKKKYNENCDMIDALREKITAEYYKAFDYKCKYEDATNTIVKQKSTIKSYKKILWIIGIYTALVTLYCILC